MATAKCYSHQVNPEMENDYSVFIVNYYVHCFCTLTIFHFIKITIDFTSLKLNSVYFLSRLNYTNQLQSLGLETLELRRLHHDLTSLPNSTYVYISAIRQNKYGLC